MATGCSSAGTQARSAVSSECFCRTSSAALTNALVQPLPSGVRTPPWFRHSRKAVLVVTETTRAFTRSTVRGPGGRRRYASHRSSVISVSVTYDILTTDTLNIQPNERSPSRKPCHRALRPCFGIICPPQPIRLDPNDCKGKSGKGQSAFTERRGRPTIASNDHRRSPARHLKPAVRNDDPGDVVPDGEGHAFVIVDHTAIADWAARTIILSL